MTKSEMPFNGISGVADRHYEAAYKEWARNNPDEVEKAKSLGVGTPKTESKSFQAPCQGEYETANPADLQSVGPVEPEEPEEYIYEAVAAYLMPHQRPQVLTDISHALDEVKKKWDTASASREADYGLQLLHLLGGSKSKEMRFKSRVLRAVIARNDDSLAQIAKDFQLTRADASKVAQEFKDFLNLRISTTTRDEKFVQQCRERADRVHAIKKDDQKRANKIKSMK